MPVAGNLGKSVPVQLGAAAECRGHPNRPQPRVVSVSQTAELGTCYSVDELTGNCARAHDLGMTVHVDGAQLSNAAVSPGVSLRELTTGTGVDVLSFGVTKVGLMFGEAVIVLRREAAQSMP